MPHGTSSRRSLAAARNRASFRTTASATTASQAEPTAQRTDKCALTVLGLSFLRGNLVEGEPSCDLLENGNCDFGSDCTDCGIRGTQSWPDWAETFTAPDDQIAKVWKGVDLELEGHDSAHLCEHPADAPHFGKEDPSSYLMERVTPTGIYGADVGKECYRSSAYGDACPTGGFCNFDTAQKEAIGNGIGSNAFVPEQGTCESCLDYATKEKCDDEGFNREEGAEDCKDKCFRPVATSEDLVLGTPIKIDVQRVTSSNIKNGDTNYVVPNPPGVGPGGFLGEKFCLKPGHYTLKITD